MEGKYALQNVLIKNSIPLAEAEKHYKNITKKKPRKVRETKGWWRFRYMPPTRFEKGSFRTKVVNDTIHLTFGKLKQEHGHLEGAGLFDYFTKAYDYVANKATSAFDYVKNALSITDYSTKTKENLEKFGDYPITQIQLRRVPIAFALDLALQGVSAGKWEELKQKYGFDRFFHLSMRVTLSGAKEITLNSGRKRRVAKQLAIEKLEVISVNDNIAVGEGMETQDVPLAGHSFSIKDMFRKARDKVGDTRWFSYSALGHNNCQDFIAMLLEAEGLYREPERQFVYQDISGLASELPDFTKAFAQGTTYLGALANKYLGVGGSRITLNQLVAQNRMDGGTKQSGFIQALIARDKSEPESKEEEAERDAEYNNKQKFKKIDKKGFKLQNLTKATKNLIIHKKELSEDEAVKQFHDYVLEHGRQFNPKSVVVPLSAKKAKKTGKTHGRVRYYDTLDIDDLFRHWKESQGIEIREARRARRNVEPEVAPPEMFAVAPANPRQAHIRELAERYNTVQKAMGLRKDDARAVFRQLGGNPRVEGNNKAYRPVRELAELIAQYAQRILQ